MENLYKGGTKMFKTKREFERIMRDHGYKLEYKRTENNTFVYVVEKDWYFGIIKVPTKINNVGAFCDIVDSLIRSDMRNIQMSIDSKLEELENE